MILDKIKSPSEVTRFTFLGLFFVVIHLFFYSQLGIKEVNDSSRYLNYSDQLINGLGFYRPHDLWYVSYVLFISCVKLFTNNLVYIVVAQILLSGIANFYLYKLSIILFGNRSVAFLSSCLYLGFVETSMWNFYILPESFYTSMMCISSYSIFNVLKSYSTKSKVICLLIVAITILAKPTGIVLLVSVFVLYIFHVKGKIKSINKWILVVGGLLMLSCFFIIIDKMLETFTLVDNYTKGEVIHRIKTLPKSPDFKWLILESDASLIVPANNSTLLNVIQFGIQNPVYFIKLASLKLFWFVVHTKPYHSLFHIIFTLFILLPLYFFAFNFFQNRNRMDVKLFFGVQVFFSSLIIALTSEDWDGRFLMPILPMLFLIASKELYDFIIKLKSKNRLVQ